MVEHAAVNRVVVGSSPTSGAIFIEGNARFQVTDTLPTQKRPQSLDADVKWPYKVRHKKNGPVLAKIYRPCAGRGDCRVTWHSLGARQMKSFPRFAGQGGAREFAERLVKELAQGSHVPLTPREAQDTLSVRDMLATYKEQTGRRVGILEAVSSFIAASRLLPANSTLIEAARVYSRTLGTVKPKQIAEAVSDFVESRKKEPKPGERARFSPIYARNVEAWLTQFSRSFSGHQVSDLTPDMLDVFFSGFKKLSAKARNDRRGTIGMWLRWCARKEFIEATQLAKLLAGDAMQSEILPDATITFYTPNELQKILDVSEGPLRAVTALQALGGARLQEALRLNYEDLHRTQGHVEISGQHAKTRRRRLLEVGPALAHWLAEFKNKTGPIWSQPLNSYVTEFARLLDDEQVRVPLKRNGLRHGFVSYSYILRGEVETSALAGTSPTILHSRYRGLVEKTEAQKWFVVAPAKADNILVLGKEATV